MSTGGRASAETRSDRELPLDWMQDVPEGLRAYARLPASGKYARDRQGRLRVSRVRLRSSQPATTPTRPAGLLADGDWNWLTSGPREWKTVTRRLGDNAYDICVALVRTGCLTIEHDVRLTTLVRPPRRLHPHPDLSGAHDEARSKKRDVDAAIRERGAALADALVDEWPDVTIALRSTTNIDRLAWAVNAATDLDTGRTHDSVRAFVQVHAGHTKARDDVHHLLAELGFEPETLAVLGLARNPYIGLGGPFQIDASTGVIDLAGLPGPHDIRLPSQQSITLRLPPRAAKLLAIENRQAAEAACDAYPSSAVVWCHGQPPTAVLALIEQAARYVDNVIIFPDADLGGVRIAARIVDNLSPHHECTVVDIGTVDHHVGKRFNTHSRNHLSVIAGRDDQIGKFALACLERGYAIEQEAAVRASLRAVLTN